MPTPFDLARAATTGRLVVAGSISSTDQMQALASIGAEAFTIGSAAFDGSQQLTPEPSDPNWLPWLVYQGNGCDLVILARGPTGRGRLTTRTTTTGGAV